MIVGGFLAAQIDATSEGWLGRAAHWIGPRLPELVVAAALVFVGIRSLRRWMRIRFDAASTLEQVVYALHVTARVGTWFALAGFFVGYAVVDEPQSFGWYVFVIVGLASVQLLTSFALWRSAGGAPRRGAGEGQDRPA